MTRREFRRASWRRTRPWLFIYTGIVAVVAVVCGIIWNRLVPLPSYVVDNDFRARIAENDLGQIVASDVYFSFVGLVGGLVIGIVAWLLFRRLGWLVTPIAGIGAGLAGLIARQVGEFIGPRNFNARVAAATQADQVRIDFVSHTWVPLVVWIGVAMVPILIGGAWKPQDWVTHVPRNPVATGPESGTEEAANPVE